MPLPPDFQRFLEDISVEAGYLLDPLSRAATNPLFLYRMLHQIGWDLDSILGLDPATLAGDMMYLLDLLDAAANVLNGAEEPEQLGPKVLKAIDAVKGTVANVQGILDVAMGIGTDLDEDMLEYYATLAASLGQDTLEHLLMLYLTRRASLLVSLGRLFGLLHVKRPSLLYFHVEKVDKQWVPLEFLPGADGNPVLDADGNPRPQLPLRYPLSRVGVNDAGLRQTFTIPLGVVTRNIDEDAFRSPEAFFVAVQGTLIDLFDEIVDAVARRGAGRLRITLDANGIAVSAPNWLPQLEDGMEAIEIPLQAGATHPNLTIDAAAWRVNWSSVEPGEGLPLLGETLVLLEAFSDGASSGEATTWNPGVYMVMEPVPQDPADLEFSLTIVMGLRVAFTPKYQNEFRVRFSLIREGADDATTFGIRAEAVGELIIPLLLPMLDGLAFAIDQPSCEMVLEIVDGEPALYFEFTAGGFGIELPTVLFKRLEPKGTAGGWTLSDEAPKIRFQLVDVSKDPPELAAEQQPLVQLRLARPADDSLGFGLAVSELRLLDPTAGSTEEPTTESTDKPNRAVRVTSDAIFVGFDPPDQGFIIQVDGFNWLFSTGSSSTLVGGISIDKATVHFPKDLEVLDSIEITEATINDKGFTGAVSVLFDEEACSETATPAPTGSGPESTRPKPLFDVLPIQLYTLNLEFEDNFPVAFDLKAAIELPYFDEWVNLTIGIDDRFNIVFKLESADPEGIVLTKEELLAITFRSAGFEYYNDIGLLRLSLSGGLEPLLWNADGLEWPKLDITNLVLEQDLSTLPARLEPPVLKFEEAWLDLKDLATLDLFGFYFELKRIGIGYVETTDKLWLDLTGSLRLIEFIPVGLGVEGFRITWPRRIYEDVFEALGIIDTDVTLEDLPVDEALDVLLAIAARIEVKFDGVYLFFGVPQAVEFEGYIRFIKEAQKVGFAGDVALRVPASGLAIEAGLMVGMNFEDPPYPFLYVHFGILLPTGIPLGQSGLALKGAQGLFGLNVYPDRTPEQNPYYDWYKRGPIEGAHPTNKWVDRIWSIAFGAGVTITTTDGKILGVRGLLALVLPGPIIFVEGKALIFEGVFPSDGPLKALGYFDGNELTAQFNIEADLELVEGVVDVNAGLEAFFDFENLTNWHLYLGKDEPPERRVRANFLKLPLVGWLFEANSYLMLDMQDEDTLQARLGVYIGFEPPAVDLVVASATVRAVIEGTGLLTVNPFQFSGRLELDAVLDVEAFGFSLVGIEAAAHMDVEGALPFVADALVQARVDLPVPNFEEVPVVGDYVGSALDWFEETVAEIPDIPEYIEVEVPFHWEFDAPPVIEPLVKGVTVQSHFASGGAEALDPRKEAITDASTDVDIWQAPVVPLDARPSLLFDQNMNQAEGLTFGGFSSRRVQRFRSGKLAFQPYLRNVEISRLSLHDFNPEADLDDQEWEIVGGTGETDEALRLWGAFRPEVDGDANQASRRVLDLWTANVFEFLTGVLPLALPADDASQDREPVSAADGFLGAGGLLWCAPGAPARSCIDARHFEEAARDEHQQPVRIPNGNAFRLKLTVRDVEFVADDLRILLPPTDRRRTREAPTPRVEQPLLQAAASAKIKLTIHFPEPVVSVTLFRPQDSKTHIVPWARRGDPVQFVESPSKFKGGGTVVTLELGKPCDEEVLVEVKEQGPITEIVGKDWFDCLELEADGPVDLTKICWITADAAAAAAIRAAECDSSAGLGGRGGDVPVVLSAGSLYRVQVTTSIQLDEEASDWSTLALYDSLGDFFPVIDRYRGEGGSEPETSTFYFRTAGPPQDLSPYVKWASPQHQSMGHFHEDDFVIRFNRSYVHRLYPDPDTTVEAGDYPYAIEALLRDAEGHVIRGFFHNWTKAGSPTLFPDEGRFLEAVNDSTSPMEPPPPDDILEIRRNMHIIRGADLGAKDWDVVPLAAPGEPSPRWKRLADGSVRVSAAGNEGGSFFIAGGFDRTEYRLECMIVLPTPRRDAIDRPTSDRDAVGIVFGYGSTGDHYLLRILFGKINTVQLVRVRREEEEILAEGAFAGPRAKPGWRILPPVPPVPIRIRLWTRRSASGMELQAIAAGAKLAAVDAFPPAGRSRLGLYARNVDAVFTKFSVTKPRQELTPGARYTLLLTGGEGGRTVLFDDFSGPDLGEHWDANSTSWSTGDDGLTPSHTGASIALRDSIEDCELVTMLEMRYRDAVRLRLRAPDAGRAPGNDTAYELLVERTATGCDVTATATTADNAGYPLDFGHADLGIAQRIPLRVRLVGDTLRVWVFEWLLIDVTLEEYEVAGTSLGRARSARGVARGTGLRRPRVSFDDLAPRIGASTHWVTIPQAWSGRVEWAVVAGEPKIRSIDLRQPALLSVDFTTSRFGSLADLFELVEPASEALVVAGYEFPEYTAHVVALAQSQRAVADARLALLATQAQYAAKRSDREAVETAKQHAVRVTAEHDEGFASLLDHCGVAYEAAPGAPTVRRLETDDGEWLGFLLHSPEPLEPELLGLPDSGPFGSVGRTRFRLSSQESGSEVPTGWIASGDGTKLIIYQRQSQDTPDHDSDVLAPVALIERAYELDIEYIRHHGDDLADVDHLYDRPYVLSRSDSGPEFVSGIVL